MKKRIIAALMCGTVLLTACSRQVEDILPESIYVQDSTVESVSSYPEESQSTVSAGESELPPPEIPMTEESVVSEPSAEANETVDIPPEAEQTEQGTEAPAQTEEATPETEPPSTSPVPTEPEQPVPEKTTAPPVTKPEPPVTETDPPVTKPAPPETTAEEPAEPEPEVPSRKPFEYSGKALDRATSFGIDIEKRVGEYRTFSEKTKLPVIHISTENEEKIISRDDYLNCLVDVFNCEEKFMMYAAEGGIKIRGNSTAYYGDPEKVTINQVPYRIKFNKKQNMLGLNDGAECKSWVLLKSTWNVMPDYIAFRLAEAIFGGEYYSSDCTFAYVYINGRIAGLYLLCEQNQVNEYRVDLPEVQENYSGTDIGYLLELDNYPSGDYFTVDYCGETLVDIEGTERKLLPAEYTIKNDIYSPKQVDFIRKYMNDVYTIMVRAIKYNRYYTFDGSYNLVPAGDKFDNAFDTINAVVDLKSAVNMYILYEIAHDYDCGEGSFYFAVDFSGQSSFDRLTFTAPWDFNWAYSDSPKKYYAAAFNAEDFVSTYGDRSNPWFILLMSTDWFRDMVVDKWAQLNADGLISGTMDAVQANLEYYWDDYTNKRFNYYSDCAQELIDWVRYRIKWLDTEWAKE